MRLGNLRIGRRMAFVVVLSVIGTLLVGVVDAWRTRAMLLEDRQVKTQHVVDVAYGIIASHQRQVEAGTLDAAKAQQDALAEIASLRYGGAEYFWINDMTPRMVMHPIKPELDGKELAGMADPTGKHLLVEFVEVAKRDGAGFVDYLWPKPGSEEPVAKISHVRGSSPGAG
jgi:methyl-accepting chemotaxis protein